MLERATLESAQMAEELRKLEEGESDRAVPVKHGKSPL